MASYRFPARHAAREVEIATIWTDHEWRCVLSWLGYRYRLRLMRGPVIVRDDSDIDENVMLDIAIQWRTEQLVRATSA